jgi:hypothetical protein
MAARVYDADANHLFQLLRFFDGGIDHDVTAFLTEFKRRNGFHETPPSEYRVSVVGRGLPKDL